jgi:uncharacterized protein (TIGR01244 family)
VTITAITNTFSISGEITEKELSYLIENDVSTLINVRPDNEGLEQKNSGAWNTICQQHGLTYFHIPVLPCQYPETAVQEFKGALTSTENKVHSFCRTGARAAHLFALANKDQFTLQQMHDLLKEKGYDFNTIAEQFKEATQDAN